MTVARVPGTRGLRLSPFGIFGWSIAAVICLAVAYPIAHVVAKALEYQDGHWRLTQILRRAFAHDTLSIVWNTLLVVGASGAIAFVIGTLLAVINERSDARLGWAGDILPVLPMLVPPVAGAIGWVFLAAPVSGFLNYWLRSGLSLFGVHMVDGPLQIFTWSGLVFVYALYLTPFVYLPMSAALRGIESSTEEAARVAGAGPWETVRRVTVPSLGPAVGAALLYVAGIGCAMFTVPIVIGVAAGVDVLPVAIVRAMNGRYPPDITGALALSFWIVVIVGVAWWLQTRLATDERHSTIGEGKGSSSALLQLGKWRWPVRAGMLLYLAATSLLPFLALLFVSLQPYWRPQIVWHQLGFRNYHLMFSDPQFGAGLKNSLVLGAVTATIAILAASLISFLVNRRRTRLGALTEGITKLPFVVPHVVIAVALVLAFAGPPFHWTGTFFILSLAYLIVYLPQASVQATSAFVQVGRPLREAASVSGAGPGRMFRSIVLPLMVPGLTAGWALLFVLMAGDVTASVMLASPHTPVVGFAIVNQWETGTFSGIAALSVVIALIKVVVVLAVIRFSRSARFAVRAQ